MQHEGGIADFLTKIIADRGKAPTTPQPFYFQRENGIRIEAALQWTESHEETLRSYVNGIPTTQGGLHEQGFRQAIVKAVRSFIDAAGLAPKNVNLTAEDIREGIVGVLSIYLHEPQFQGQTKERLGNPEAAQLVDSAIRPALETFLLENRTSGATVVDRIVLAAKAREASRAASQSVSRKTAISHRLNLPGKLADCSSTDPGKSELFIVEGDSAGGSAKQGRERRFQAILPLRGKVLNAEQASLQKVLSNKELQDVVSALGCGVGRGVQLGTAALPQGRLPDGRRLRRTPHRDAATHLLLPPSAATHRGWPRLSGPAAALPHRPRQGNPLGAGRSRPRPHRRDTAQERQAGHHALQGFG